MSGGGVGGGGERWGCGWRGGEVWVEGEGEGVGEDGVCVCGGGGGGGVLTGNCSLSIASLLMDQTNTSYFSVRNNPPLVCSVALSGANCSSCGSPEFTSGQPQKMGVTYTLTVNL